MFRLAKHGKCIFAFYCLQPTLTIIKHKFVFSNFSGAAGISQQNPGISRQKSLISLVSRDIPNLLAPTPSRGRTPTPLENIRTKKFGFGFLFLPWLASRKHCKFEYVATLQSLIVREHQTCTKSWLPFVSPRPPLFPKGNWPFSGTGKTPPLSVGSPTIFTGSPVWIHCFLPPGNWERNGRPQFGAWLILSEIGTPENAAMRSDPAVIIYCKVLGGAKL